MTDQLQRAAIERDVVIAEGPDTAGYLQGQLSQDIDALDRGDSAWSFLLEPQGKVVALVRVTRDDVERFLLDVDPGWGEAVVSRLERFKLRSDMELTLERWPGEARRGLGASETSADAPIAADAAWDGIESIDVVGPDVVAAPTVDADTYESLRIRARWPAMGAELDESTIPAATGVVDLAASFTKGCYTGQELVARIESRGNKTPTRLTRVRADDPDCRLAAGGDLFAGEAAAGTITSASATEPVALAYVKRAVEVPGPAEAVDAAGRRVPVSLLP